MQQHILASDRASAEAVAHDINNLLGVVVTNLDLLSEQLIGDPQVTNLIAEIVAAAVRASELSRTLMPGGPSQRPLASSADQTTAMLAGHPPASVLVVDDNAELRVAVARQLTELGYVAVEAADGPAALMILNTRPVDLLFTDVVMPGGMSGFDLARLVLGRWPQMKAVITTAYPELEPAGDSTTAGKLRRLLKPYRKGELAQTLSEVLDRQLATSAPSA